MTPKNRMENSSGKQEKEKKQEPRIVLAFFNLTQSNFYEKTLLFLNGTTKLQWNLVNTSQSKLNNVNSSFSIR